MQLSARRPPAVLRLVKRCVAHAADLLVSTREGGLVAAGTRVSPDWNLRAAGPGRTGGYVADKEREGEDLFLRSARRLYRVVGRPQMRAFEATKAALELIAARSPELFRAVQLAVVDTADELDVLQGDDAAEDLLAQGDEDDPEEEGGREDGPGEASASQGPGRGGARCRPHSRAASACQRRSSAAAPPPPSRALPPP